MKGVLVFSLQSTSRVLQSLQMCTNLQSLFFALQRTEPQVHLPLLYPPRASFSQEQRLVALVGWSKLGGKGEVQNPYFQKMLFSAQLLGEKGKNDRLNNTREGESGKENVTSEKECWGLLHHWGVLQTHMKKYSLFSFSQLSPGFLLCLLATCMQTPEVCTRYCIW